VDAPEGNPKGFPFLFYALVFPFFFACCFFLPFLSFLPSRFIVFCRFLSACPCFSVLPAGQTGISSCPFSSVRMKTRISPPRTSAAAFPSSVISSGEKAGVF